MRRYEAFSDYDKICIDLKMVYNKIIDMNTVTVSPKFQVVIPRQIRKRMGLEPGMRLHVFNHDDRVEFIPVRSPKSMRGILKGMNTSIDREEDRV
jgi:AbrB family looped-hinge helix DNA binding protein